MRSTDRNMPAWATRGPQRPPEHRLRDTVASELDREMSVAPSIALGQGERGHVAEGPCDGGPVGLPHTLSAKDGDVIRVPVPARTHTAPRRGVSSRGCWSFDGVLVLSARSRPAPLVTRGSG